MPIHNKIFIFSFLFIVSFVGHSQTNTAHLSESKKVSKHIPDLLKVEIEEALSYYPELKNIKIDFIFKNKINHAVMQAQPRIRTLFRKKERRVYKIKMCRTLLLNDSVKSIEFLPHDIIVGWIAHELGHIVDYMDRSSFQMIGFGVRYFTSRPYLKRAERRADTHAINHGFADHLIKTKEYILHKGPLPESYKARIDQLYISSDEVRALEQKLDIN